VTVDLDRELIATLVRTGDPELFRQLVERYQDRVFRLVASVLGPYSEADAEEVTQEVFLRVYRQLKGFRGDAKFGTWIYRVAYRRALDRKQLARHRLPHSTEEALADVAGPDNPFEQAARSQQGERVAICMEALPDLYRTVLYLRYWMDCPVEEIAELIEAPAGTVKSYLARARQRVERELEKSGHV
jgi:RNA polymerase sigma-70 factor (ECF subfamily)